MKVLNRFTKCFLSLHDFAFAGCGNGYVVDNRITKSDVLLLTKEKIESPASTQEYVAAILGMVRKPMVQKCLNAISISYLPNKGDHCRRK